MNKFQFLGRLSKDVELKTINDTQIATFDLAVARRFNNEQTKADFFHITAFGKTAEFCSKYFSKGQQVLVEGRIQNRTWEDQTGAKRYATDYIAEQVYFADSNKTKEEIPNQQDFVTVDYEEGLPF